MLYPRYKPGGIVNTACYIANAWKWSYQLWFKFGGDKEALFKHYKQKDCVGFPYNESDYRTKDTSNITKRRKR